MLRQNPLWPYLLVLVALFVLIVNAPRRWEHLVRSNSIRAELVRRTESPKHERRPLSETPVYHYVPPQTARLQPVVGDAELEDESLVSGITQPSHDAALQRPVGTGSTSLMVADSQSAFPPQPVPIGELAVGNPKSADAQPKPALPIPTALLKQLEITGKIPTCVCWTTEIDTLLARLSSADTDAETATEIIDELVQIASDGDALAEQLSREAHKTAVRRLQYALDRRIVVWKQVAHDRAESNAVGSDTPLDRSQSLALHETIDELRRLLAGPEGLAWQEFLLLDRLEDAERRDADSASKAELAREVLARLSSPSLALSQQQFIAQPHIVQLARNLSGWTGESIRPIDVLAHLEQFEDTGSISDAARLADAARRLRWSIDAADQELADHLDEHYRNANIRMAVSAELVNRLLPQPEARELPVRDQIMGARVRGRSTTITKLFARLTPDRYRLRLGLEASGRVLSNTASTSGPATFYNSGESTFLARKDFVFGQDGLQIFPAISHAENQYTSLRRMETDYDQIPLIGSIVRNIARNEHDSAQGQARQETEGRIASQSGSQLDAEIEPRIREARHRFKQKVQAPLEKLALEAAPIDMSTTAERLTVRLRVAGHDQLAAYTARPRALSNSVISLQIHESALNNTLSRLELDGREFTLPELYKWIGERLSRPDVPLPDDLPEDVTVKFAPTDAVQVRCEDEHVEIRLAIARLKQGRKQWRNFAVRTFYRPDHEQLRAQFVRDSAIFLDGESLKGKPQVVLRAIFSKVLSQKRPWSIVDERLAADPRLQDLQITQFITDQGWIALAYGPKGTPEVASKPSQVQSNH